jgi:hypothetical protein
VTLQIGARMGMAVENAKTSAKFAKKTTGKNDSLSKNNEIRQKILKISIAAFKMRTS